MVNAWSLLWSEINGTMDEDYPIMNKNDDITIVGGGSSDTITFTGMSTAIGAADTINIGSPIFGSASPDTIDFGGSHVRGGMGDDHISFNVDLDYTGLANTAYDEPKYYSDINGIVAGNDPYPTLGNIKPKPSIPAPRSC